MHETISTSDKAFVDTNVLVYAHDASTGEKHDLARKLLARLWASRSGVVSTQVLQELCATLRRHAAHPIDLQDLSDLVTDYLAWDVQVNTGDSVLEALEIQRRYQVSFWDALILSAAGRSGATIVYSEDLAHGQRYGSVRAVNPFVAAAPSP